jgi:hypothetical protein
MARLGRSPYLALASTLALVALTAGCRLSFPSFTGKLPPGPPANAGRAPAQKSAAKNPPPRAAAKAKAATPAPPPVGPRLSTLIARDELEKLAAGRVVFDAPEQMRAGVTERVEARLGESLYEDFARRLEDLGITNGDEIVSASSVNAALTGNGFEIKATTDKETARGGAFTPWSWEVTPLRSGERSLALTVTVTTGIPGGPDEKMDLPVLTKTVTVSASPDTSTGQFIEAIWPWIAAALFATALAAWLIRRQKI